MCSWTPSQTVTLSLSALYGSFKIFLHLLAPGPLGHCLASIVVKDPQIITKKVRPSKTKPKGSSRWKEVASEAVSEVG